MPNSFDYEGYSPSNRVLFLVGACCALVAGLVVVLAVAKSKGDLDNIVRVEAELVNVGDGLPEKSDVKYRGVLVGHVEDVTTAPAGQPNIVHIALKPEYAPGIPDSVTARVVPSNVFAVSSVQLIDPGTTGRPLHPGSVIREDTSMPTVLFQTTLNKFRKVFEAIAKRPGISGPGLLEALSEATHGKGEQIRASGGDLKAIVDQLNTVIGDGASPSTLSALTEATSTLNQAAPDLFTALHEAVRPMQTLAEKRGALAHFLAAGLTTTGTLADAFEHQTNRLINITTELTPVVGVLADNNAQFHPIFTRVQTLAQNMLDIYNPDTTQFTVKAVASLTPTRTYVRADCPRYGALEGPSCHTAPEVPTAPSLYPALGSVGLPPPVGVTDNRANVAPPRDSVRHAGDLPGQGPLPGPDPDSGSGPAPAEASIQQQANTFGGSVGPVGSEQERQQLSQITGTPATAATQLLLGPVVRGATVEMTPAAGGPR